MGSILCLNLSLDKTSYQYRLTSRYRLIPGSPTTLIVDKFDQDTYSRVLYLTAAQFLGVNQDDRFCISVTVLQKTVHYHKFTFFPME